MKLENTKFCIKVTEENKDKILKFALEYKDEYEGYSYSWNLERASINNFYFHYPQVEINLWTDNKPNHPIILDKEFDDIINKFDFFILPETWHIYVTEENQSILEKWRFDETPLPLEIGGYIGQYDWGEGSISKEHNYKGAFKPDKGFGIEITTKQFVKHVLKQNNVMTTQKVSRSAMEEIYNIACTDWKKTIEFWTKPFGDTELTQQQVDNMYSAANSTQKIVLDKYLKKENTLKDIKGTLSYFNESGNRSNSMIATRTEGEYRNKAFYLNDQFNWEIKKDNLNTLVLIPTKR